MAVNPTPVFAPGTKARAIQVSGGFDQTGSFLGISVTLEITLPDGNKLGQQITYPLASLLDPQFVSDAQAQVPGAVRQLVTNLGCDYG